MLYIYSPEEVYHSLKKKCYSKVKSVLHTDDKVFAVDQHCYDVLIFPSHLKSDLLNTDLFKDYKLIFQVNSYLFSFASQYSYLFKESLHLKVKPNKLILFFIDIQGGF